MTRPFFVAMVMVMGHVMAGCAAAPSSSAAPRDHSPLASLAWLSGSWASHPDDRGVVTEEHWMEPRGGSMIGINRTASIARTAFFEFLRIESRDDGGVYYLASPAGRHPPTPFKLIESGTMMAMFENPQHDFPQRITYERRGEELLMSTRGVEDGEERAEAWRLHRVTRD